MPEEDVARALAAKVSEDATALAVTTAKDARDLAAKAAESMGAINQRLQEHTASDELHFQKISNDLTAMKDNHLHHIEKDIATIATGMRSLHEKVDANSRDTNETKMANSKLSSDLGWVIKIGAGAWAVALILFAAMVVIVREAATKSS